MFPKIDLDTVKERIEENIEKNNQGTTYLYDFEKMDFVIKGGRLVEVEGIEGVKIWIEKILRTERFRFQIYGEYGVSIKTLVKGRKIPILLLQSELKRQIEEALYRNSDIERIEDFNTKQEMATLLIYFTVILTSGETFIQEVSF